MPIRILIFSFFFLGLVTAVMAQAPNPFGNTLPGPGASEKPAVFLPPAEPNSPLPLPAFMNDWMKQAIQYQRMMTKEVSLAVRSIQSGESLWSLATAFSVCFFYGVFHALGPYHGKLIVVGYFLGREAKWWRSFQMGLEIGLTHVVGAVIMVLLTRIAVELAPIAQELRDIWLQRLSFALVSLTGIYLIYTAIKAARERRKLRHEMRLVQLSPSAGDPCCPPLQANSQSGRFLAIVAGLVPCTGSVLVLLFTLSQDALMLGLILVLAIAAGMAMTLAAIGLFGIYGRKLVLWRRQAGPNIPGPFTSVVELAGGGMVLLIGLLLLLGS